ncbi:hypothetical protein [Shewanella sp. Isolate11]|uniref:hypothetical protein n=1 Tax=Shewanella sp. Isolate11 TaxID=2908530 RepID=UPI001EFE7885|nr:hypothetical protein [Shewanella sp. Isolate11]MCG9698429.1 hypothetical protein [Shewanella sp. Isolate11]
MNHLLMTLPFVLFGGLMLVILAKSDPRRQYSARKFAAKNIAKDSVQLNLSPMIRKMLAFSLLLPMIALLLMANYAGILMYAGALTVVGWLIAELPSSLV